MIPTNFIYWLAFEYLEKKRLNTIIEEETSVLKERPGQITPVMEDKEEVDSIINEELTSRNLKKVWPKVGFLVVNLGLVSN